ncbi:aldo/keto reductase [Vibrio gallicus]|uniref:aldo/keto reductase n=1 Tax=Vibrio gallicus TaxID=190897 RepID=UPI0021C3FD2B|nr:aldo/keto reductase [Vibrio gallicus]
MEYSKLGSSNLNVSRVCLGSMTWGQQNNQQDADQQIEFALNQGVNFIDTAELYSIPPSPKTYGKTEAIIGDWLSRNRNQRQNLIIASKIAGAGLSWIRDGGPITGEAIIQSVDNSLQRLQTDYMDLYQLHWPNRTSPHFGKQWPGMITFSDEDSKQQTSQMLEILQALSECVKAGKIRHCGLSDDTPWGIATYLKLSQQYDLPKMVSIQNEFSLLNLKDWPYLIEQCIHEDIAYLPWSPLGGGVLSGKYANGARPEGSRWTLAQRQGLFRNTQASHNAVAEYIRIADSLNITPAQLALAWCNQVDGVTSTIIGATNLTQLEEDISAFDITLDNDTLTKIGDVIKQFPMPY